MLLTHNLFYANFSIILLATCKAVSDKLGVAADYLFHSSFNDILFERFPQLRDAVTIKSHKTFRMDYGFSKYLSLYYIHRDA
jgi:hypothetical protein